MRPRLRTTTPTTRRACLLRSPACQCGPSMTLKSRASALARVTSANPRTASLVEHESTELTAFSLVQRASVW